MSYYNVCLLYFLMLSSCLALETDMIVKALLRIPFTFFYHLLPPRLCRFDPFWQSLARLVTRQHVRLYSSLVKVDPAAKVASWAYPKFHLGRT